MPPVSFYLPFGLFAVNGIFLILKEIKPKGIGGPELCSRIV